MIMFSIFFQQIHMKLYFTISLSANLLKILTVGGYIKITAGSIDDSAYLLTKCGCKETPCAAFNEREDFWDFFYFSTCAAEIVGI